MIFYQSTLTASPRANCASNLDFLKTNLQANLILSGGFFRPPVTDSGDWPGTDREVRLNIGLLGSGFKFSHKNIFGLMEAAGV